MSEPVAPLDSSWHVSGDEPICPKFQPNIFDPSRCHECLRQRQLHTGAGESTDTVPQQKPLTEPQTGTDPIGFGSNRGVLLTPIPSQAEESNTSSSKDESDSFSVVSSYCDVNGGCAGYGSLCILSPDCELYICEGDDDYSTDSCRDQSEEFSSSISAEEEYLPIQRRPTRYSMTRLDPPPHRPNPRAWMEDTRGGSSLTGRSGLKEDRERHESGYYSLGRATGARLLSEKSPPAPFRHFERGHPLFSNRNIEPKDTIPFRNPNLGVASERQIPEAYDESLPVEIPPPDPYEVAVEVEAQVGPRSPSPTPFKIAESLASSGRKGSGRGYPLSQNSSYQQSERYDSSRQSRSSSPSRGNLQIRRSESSDLLGGKNFDGGGRSHATTPRSMSPLPNTQGRHFASGTLPRNFKSFASQSTQGQRFEAGTLPRNFKSFASSVKSQSNAISDFRSTLRKKEGNGSSVGRGDVRSSSPSRTDRNSSVLMSRHSESTTNLSHGRGGNSRASSPSRRTSDRARDTHFSSLPSRNFSPISRSILRKSESVVSLNEHSHHGRCGSPIREGYSIENQAQLRHELTRTGLNDEEHNEDPTVSLSRQDYDRPRQYVLRKTEANTVSSGRGWESRSSSPGRRIHETPDQHQLRRRNPSGGSLNGHGHEKRNSSPSRRNYEATSQSLQSKSEFNSSVRNNDSYSSSALRKTYDAPDQRKPQIIKAGFSINSKTQNTRSYSPCQKGSADPPGYSVFRSATNEQSSHSFQRKNTSEVNLDSSRSPNSWRGSSLHSSSISRSTSPSRQNPNGNRITRVTLETTRTSSSIRSAHSRLRDEDRCPTPNSKQPSQQARSPSFPPQMDKRSSHRAQSPSPPPKIDKRSSHRTQSPSPPPQIDKRSSHRTQTPSPPTQIDKRSSHRAQSPSPSTQFYKRSSHRARSPSPSPQLNKWSSHRARSPSPPTQTDKRSSHRARSPSPSPQIDKRSSHHAQRPSPSALINKRSSHRAQSPSPPPQIHIQSHTSSQSSLASSESVPNSVGSTGRNREEYTMMADVPKVKMIHQREEMSHTGPQQNNQPIRRQELFKPASHSLSRHPSTEWDDTWDMEREWHYGGSGYLSRAQSTTSLQRSGSPTTADEGSSWKSTDHRSEQMQPDLLNFKKGWMSKLDESGEWKKHWFVLTDAGLKYYRDSSAEEKDDLDGEIDLKSCVKVSEFDVEKNYGFRIQTREAMFTLSAMTAGIRRNWIEVLKKCIRPSSSPDLTQLPDNNSDKENSHTRFLSSRHQSLRHGDSQSEVSSSAPAIKHRFDYVELSPVPASSGALPPGQREAGEGQGREHSQWQEERNTSSQWEAVLSRKGTTVGSNQRLHMEDEIEKKWAEFERMPLKEMSSIPPTHSRSSSQSAETLQREVASLRQQLAQLQQGGGGGGGKVWGVCGPEAPCSRSLVAMERAHKQALEELQRQHERQMRELEREKDRLLLEEAQDTARVMEALKKKHKEELEREVETVKRLSSGKLDSQSLRSQQQAETQSLQRELAGLSERYSQKCLELNQAEQRNAEREREISRKERDMEQLRKENLDLKARLTEEMTRIRSAVTDPCSEDPKDKRPCELQVLLRMKENEIEYLHKEISCLRNELQFLNMEKQLACERYAEVHGELNGMKGRTEREIQSLKEHLRLALAALQEGQKLGNSLDH